MLRLALVLLGAALLIVALSIGSDHGCGAYFIRSVGPPACAGPDIELSRWEVLNPRYANFWAGVGAATTVIGIAHLALHRVRRARRAQP